MNRVWVALLVLCVACGGGSSEPEAGSGGGAGIAGTGVAGTGGDAGMAGTGGMAGEAGTGGGNPNRVPASGVCQRLAELQCQGEATCCPNPARKYASTEVCIQSQRDFCETNSRVTQVGSDADAAFSIDHVETIFDGFQQRVEACDINIAAWGVSSEGLRNMFRGTKSQNAMCNPTSATDYGAGVSCRLDDNLVCVPGIQVTPQVPPTAWTCKPRGGVGGPCYTDLNCNDDLRCEEPETLSQCVARKQPGETCATPNECLSLLCEQGTCRAPNAEDAYCLGGG